MAAARAWAAGTLDAAPTRPIREPEAVADARRWGLDGAELEAVRQYLQFGPIQTAVWAANAETVSAFLCAGTQWRTGLDVVGGRVRMVWIGLDYASARVSIVESGMAITPDLWTGLRIMETAARDALNGETVN